MNRVKRIFEKMGAFLVDHLHLDQPEKGRQGLLQELESLRAQSGESVRGYYIRKLSVLLMVLTAGLVLTLICYVFCPTEGQEVAGQLLVRPGYGEGDRKEELALQVDGEETLKLEVTVQERKYTEKEIQELMDRAVGELEEVIRGENESLDEVRSNLVFPESMEGGAVTASWMTVPYGVIDEYGQLTGAADEKGVLVEIQGTLTCGGKETLYTAYAKVFPQILPEDEQLCRSVREEVERADADSSHRETLSLPETFDGRKLVWLYPQENPFLSVLALSLLAAVAIYLQMDNQIHKKAEARKNQLMLDYPDLMWKMMMLLDAGLGLKGTFFRISEQYHREKAADPAGRRKQRAAVLRRKTRYVYEEITYTCYEMQSGIPEAEAYERFGRRCQLPEYIRLGAVLAQNLKKGSKGLTSLLETEASSSLNERKNHARKLCEKAGTKLLLPMIMMLGIVLVVLMVPAFLSF